MSYIQLQAYTCLQLVIAYVRASASIKHALLITQTVGLAASHEMLQTFSAYSGRLSSHSTMETSMFISMVRKLAGFPSLSWGVNKGAKICLLSSPFSFLLLFLLNDQIWEQLCGCDYRHGGLLYADDLTANDSSIAEK